MTEPLSVVSQPGDDTAASARRDPDWWEARYQSGDAPWDTGVTPPEVVRLVASGRVPTGWALDLGCGSGVTSRFLAANGFRTIGLDLSLLALRRGARLAALEALPCAFLRASVADLAFLRVSVTLAVDIGCFHSLPAEARQSYVRSLAARVVRGGYYLLYGFVPQASLSADEPGGLGLRLADVAAFAPWFVLRSTAYGEDRARASAWFLMQRA